VCFAGRNILTLNPSLAFLNLLRYPVLANKWVGLENGYLPVEELLFHGWIILQTFTDFSGKRNCGTGKAPYGPSVLLRSDFKSPLLFKRFTVAIGLRVNLFSLFRRCKA